MAIMPILLMFCNYIFLFLPTNFVLSCQSCLKQSNKYFRLNKVYRLLIDIQFNLLMLHLQLPVNFRYLLNIVFMCNVLYMFS